MRPYTIFLEESCGIARLQEPVTIGIPFPKGVVFSDARIFLFDDKNNSLDLQTRILDCWSDRSIRWLLLDFQASVEANATAVYQVVVDEKSSRTKPKQFIRVIKNSESIMVNTGVSEFCLDRSLLRPFCNVVQKGLDILQPQESEIILTDKHGQEYFPRINNVLIETEGPLRTTLKITGDFLSKKNKFFAKYIARLTFFVNKSFVKCEFTIHNPRPAKHPGGLWDLGDKGSIFFQDLSFVSRLAASKQECVAGWKSGTKGAYHRSRQPVRVYQDSSGGNNWMSPNHKNRFGKVMNSFCDYRVYEGEKVTEEGKRAEPVVSVAAKDKRVSSAVKGFWQNFPNAIETKDNLLIIRLFPKYYQDIFELQGGEQKTQIVYIDYSLNPADSSSLEWINKPLIPGLNSECYSGSEAFGYLTLQNQDSHPGYKDLVNCAIEGSDTFLDKREKVDEYGWRNFGCLYADHEAVGHKEKDVLVSHYNNQYDVLQGLILQYARSGDYRWFDLLEPLAYHTVDIDIYHTDKDKPAYNGGLFWHTEHYTDANTATHRTYSKASLKTKPAKYCGGGPANEHNYTTGLLNMYFLTGNLYFKEAVIGLADWVINMDDGAKTILRFLDKGPTGLASRSASNDYHGPGRGAGNSINALIDVHTLTKDKKYLLKAEELIQRCVHPQADIEAQRLREPEIRWFYLVFLQALGKYLDYKLELEQADYMFHYARESLLYYARWMDKNETPYRLMKDKVLIWTETWPAHDMRKSNIFDFAAKYSQGEERRKFLEKAEYYYNSCVEELLTSSTRTLLRPVVILLHYGLMHGYLCKQIDGFNAPGNNGYKFGQPKTFIPQKVRVKRKIFAI